MTLALIFSSKLNLNHVITRFQLREILAVRLRSCMRVCRTLTTPKKGMSTFINVEGFSKKFTSKIGVFCMNALKI